MKRSRFTEEQIIAILRVNFNRRTPWLTLLLAMTGRADESALTFFSIDTMKVAFKLVYEEQFRSCGWNSSD